MTPRSTVPLPVLVTGGAGFLGSQVTAALVAAGRSVIALDVQHGQGKLDASLPGVEVVEGDVRDEALVDRLVARSERVIHLAGIAGVHDYLQRAAEVLDVNLMGSRAVLYAAHRHGRPVLFASTSEAYGKSSDDLREDGDTVLGPTANARWVYSVSKLAAEHLAWALTRDGLTAAAVRYFNAYGPHIDAPGRGRVLSQFLGAVQEGRPLELVDGGHAVRCFCYVDDAVEATVGLALALKPGPLVGRPFNIGNREPVTMRQLAESIIRLTGHQAGMIDRSGLEFFGKGFEDIPRRVPDVTAIHQAIGWKARTHLEDGLRATLDVWGLLKPDAPRPTPPVVPVIRPYYDADTALLERIRGAFQEGRTTNAGPHVTALESESAAWLGVDRVVSVGSGADGLEAALLALGRTGAAILPSFTYIATLNAVERAGLRPILADIDPHTWTMDPDHLATLLAAHPDVSVVVPVNVFGVPPDLDRIMPLAKAAGAAVLLDAAHAIGSSHDGRRVDPRPDLTVFSLHATKVWPSIEGGLVLARDPALASRVATVRTHGLAPDMRDSIVGFNGKLDEISAATARHGLVHLEHTLTRRRAYDSRLRAALARAGWTVQHVPHGVTTNGQNLCALAPTTLESARDTLAAHGIATRRYFDPPLHHLRRLGDVPTPPVTEDVWSRLLCLPLHSHMDDATLSRMEAAIAETGGSR